MNAPGHVILTRFNLPSEGHESLVRAREGWLRNRVELFERYCLPSVKAQTSQNFRWIIYFDPQSPNWLLTRIEDWRRFSALAPIFRATVSREELQDDLRRVTGAQGSMLYTTNLDNDDGLAADFIERLQAEPVAALRTAIWFERGLIRKDNRLYLQIDRHNAFCSVRESWDNPVSCWAAHHNKLGGVMGEHFIGGEPGWLQVVHGANVSNRVHGVLAAPAAHVSRFPGLIDDATSPSLGDHVIERLWLRPARMMREAARLTVKQIVWSAFGHDGLDRVKHFWTAVTGRLSRG